MKPRWVEIPAARGAYAVRSTYLFLRVVYKWEGSKAGFKNVFWRDWFKTVGLLLFLWLLDPIDIASNSARESAELFYRVVSAAYDAPTALGKEDSNDPSDDNSNIAVIIINDETLKVINDRTPSLEKIYWPPPFSLHAAVVEKIFLYNPKALFIDFGFFDERDKKDLANFIEVLDNRFVLLASEAHKACNPNLLKFKECEGAVRKVPVFLAGAPKATDRTKSRFDLQVIPELEKIVTGTVSTRYSTEHELPYNSYPLYDCFTEQPSAALAMYAAGNNDWPDWSLNLTPCPGAAQREKRNWQGGPNSLSVYWASWGDARSSRGSYACRALPPSLQGRVVRIIRNWFVGLFRSDDSWREQFQVCPPHRSYAAQDFLADESEVLVDFLKGRYVFYGGNFAMADDLVTPPTHEPIPGVFLHAMALDNLLRSAGEYIRVEGDSGLGAATTWLTLAAIAFTGFCSVAAWNGYEAISARPAGQSTRDLSFERDPALSKAEAFWSWLRPAGGFFIGVIWVLIFLGFSVAGVFFVLWIGFSVLNLAPINYIGILSFVGVHAVVRGSGELFRSVLGGG